MNNQAHLSKDKFAGASISGTLDKRISGMVIKPKPIAKGFVVQRKARERKATIAGRDNSPDEIANVCKTVSTQKSDRQTRKLLAGQMSGFVSLWDDSVHAYYPGAPRVGWTMARTKIYRDFILRQRGSLDDATKFIETVIREWEHITKTKLRFLKGGPPKIPSVEFLVRFAGAFAEGYWEVTNGAKFKETIKPKPVSNKALTAALTDNQRLYDENARLKEAMRTGSKIFIDDWAEFDESKPH